MEYSKKIYLPSLDGIRAIAIIMVFISHAGWGHIVPGGFGVTIFFFLSGYLITTLLRVEYENLGEINLKKFYLRRIYRILPPMYFVLFVVLILWKFGILVGNISLYGLLAQIFQVTNYYILNATEIQIAPYTGILWSLAVEEHFYLIFPAFFIFSLKRWSYPKIAKLCLGLCLLVLIWRCILVFGYDVSTNRTYIATDTRLDSILFGCIMGTWMNPALDQTTSIANSVLCEIMTLCAAIALLIFSLTYRNDAFRETLRYTLQGIALFPVFWLAIRHPDWPIFRILNAKLLRAVGKISYVIYLSHFFMLHIAESLVKGRLAITLTAITMTILFSIFVYYLVELPFARLRSNRASVLNDRNLRTL